MSTRVRGLATVALPAVTAILLVAAWALYKHGRSLSVPLVQTPRTVEEVVRAVDRDAGERMRAALSAAGVPRSPRRLWLLGIKDARVLELYAEDAKGRRVRVRSWPILAASGDAGPKLRRGDYQVPEGIYRIDRLNPNSAYHLSLGLDYPNAQDRARARADGRTELGGDIFIHGKDVSIGCLAIGDDAIEELFWLAARVGRERFTVVIVPTDLRRHPPPPITRPAWVPALYRELEAELRAFPDSGS